MAGVFYRTLNPGERFVEETPLAMEQCSFGASLETFWHDLEGQILVEGDH